jgi:ketosteroid isomerase-like protein
MAQTISHQHVRDFYEARMSRDPEKIDLFLDDDVTWSISGPIDVIPFAGVRRGREAVIDAIVRVVPAMLTVTKLEVEELIVDRDRAAGFTRVTAVQASTKRVISYQRAEFFQFRGNKIVAYRSIMDSFDVVEQVIGHPIDLSLIEKPANVFGNLIVA